jgi:hypothetical protein
METLARSGPTGRSGCSCFYVVWRASRWGVVIMRDDRGGRAGGKGITEWDVTVLNRQTIIDVLVHA